MNEQVFYHPELNTSSKELIFDGNEFHHMVHVLRSYEGQSIDVISGRGHYARGRIVKISKKNALVELSDIEVTSRPEASLILCVGLLKKREKMEWIVEKAVELGVNELVFFKSQHAERVEINLERLNKIVLSAMKQSGQVFMPVLSFESKFEKLLDQYQRADCQKLIAWCGAGTKSFLGRTQVQQKAALVCIGPEGGFSQSEVELAIGKGFVPVSLGDNRLRTETAAIFSLSVLKSKMY